MRSFSILFSSFLIVSQITAQTEIEYRFTTTLEKGAVYMRIVIEAGSTCNGIFIERSIDSLQFEEVGSIPGVCGNSANDVYYSFTDVNPVANHVNYYRIRFGDNGFSEVVSVLYIAFSNHYKAIPNPSKTNLSIHFTNPDKSSYNLVVVDIHGNIVLRIENFKTEVVSFSVQNLVSGYYLFILTGSNVPDIKGQFLVAH